MIKAFSQKLMPPFSGQVQIVESDTYRALALDSQMWEIQYLKRSHIRVGTMSAADIRSRHYDPSQFDQDAADPALMTLLDYMADVEVPLPSADHFEYWLLDGQNKTPLALLFSCKKEEQMCKFPSRASWTALPDSLMPIKKTEKELASGAPPVNYRFESLVNERAGINSKAKWFNRLERQDDHFPPLLVSENWPEPDQQELCKRYIERQAPRLLMLQGLDESHRQRLEACCKPYAVEVARFYGLYPHIIEEESINALRVEARLREASGVVDKPKLRLN